MSGYPPRPIWPTLLAAAVVILLALFLLALFLWACLTGPSDPSPNTACKGHGGVKEVGEEQYVEIPEINLFYRTVCKDGLSVQTGGIK